MKRVFLLLSLAAPAFAQDEKTEDGRPVRYKQETLVDFEDLEVGGQLVGPGIILSDERPPARFIPMTRVRLDMNDFMAESVGEVK